MKNKLKQNKKREHICSKKNIWNALIRKIRITFGNELVKNIKCSCEKN